MTTYSAFSPTALLQGDLPHIADDVTVASGAGVIPYGTLLGKVTATGKYIPSVRTAADGSQNPVAVFANLAGVDATSADQVGSAYFIGEFAFERLTVDASWSLAQLKAALRSGNTQVYVRAVGTAP
jgi:hypothetical protein